MTLNETMLDLNELFAVEKQANYHVLFFKKPNEKVIIYDPGLYHTALCRSEVSRVDTLDGKLYYRGVPVEEKIHEEFLSVAGDILFGENSEKKESFKDSVIFHFHLLDEQKKLMDSISPHVHPMDFLNMSIVALSGIEKKYLKDVSNYIEKAAFLTAQVAITVCYYYTKLRGGQWRVPSEKLTHSENILFLMHQGKETEKLEKLAKILNTIMILHAEHGQNCSASTVRNIASSKGSIYTAVAAGMAAFNGIIHGGASQLVSEMYDELLSSGINVDDYVDRKIKHKQLLMGFGQRTYNRIPNCWDPRVETMYKILTHPSFNYPEVESYKNVALLLIERVKNDRFFQEKNLTPNPDLFNCIFYKLFGVPKEMNTMMLALGRIIGWISNFIEHVDHRYPLTRPCDLNVSLETEK